MKTTSTSHRAARRDYVLRLYVTGATPRSQKAITNLKSICAEYLPDCCDLEVVDIYQSPLLAKHAGIIAVPTLIKQLPPPVRRIVGDLSERDRVLVLLNLKPRKRMHG